jgi:hypothetical protein
MSPAPNVVEENSTKALSADCCFMEPEGANSARSSYRLLCEVVAYILITFFNFFITLF